ncbi:MAG: peptidylprolyl isomerase [Firmicutes bacterium]|nr:peptidylprolyl isomerase [Bacillota bacterium]MCL2771090.1 peptidylprolyl isomerase [Bacillota bacterium]
MEIIKVRMVIENKGDMLIELYPEIAPKTVENFLRLVDDRFYSGKVFHRVIKDFMIQGGCPFGDGTGRAGPNVVAEYGNNRVEKWMKHTRGVVSLARGEGRDSGNCQFFIVHRDSPHLDGRYAAFGKVVIGLDILDKIASTETCARDRPKTPQRILKIERVK